MSDVVNSTIKFSMTNVIPRVLEGGHQCGGKSQDKRIGGRDILTDSQKLSKIEGCSPPHHLAVKKKKNLEAPWRDFVGLCGLLGPLKTDA